MKVPHSTAFDTGWFEQLFRLNTGGPIKIALFIGRSQAEGRAATMGAIYDALPIGERTIVANVQKLISAGLIEQKGKQFFTASTYAPPYSVFETRQAIPAATRQAVYERDGHICTYCGTPESLSLDHVVPWSRGGADTVDNLVTACRSCNSKKNAKTPTEWLGGVN